MGWESGCPRVFRAAFIVSGVLALSALSEGASAQTLGVRLPDPATVVANARNLISDVQDDEIPCDVLMQIEVRGDADSIGAQLQTLIEQFGGDRQRVTEFRRLKERLDKAVYDYERYCEKAPTRIGRLRIEGYVRTDSQPIGDKIGIGVVQIAGDPFFAKQKSAVDSLALGGTLGYSSGQWLYSLGFNYQWGSETVRAGKALGGNNVGYVPGDTAYGAGVFSGQATTASSEYSLDTATLVARAMRQFNLENGFNWGWSTPEELRESEKRFGWVGTVELRRGDHDAQIYWTDFPNDFNIRVDQELRTTSLTFGPAISGMRKFGGGFYVYGYGDFQAGLMNSRLNSSEDILCTVCGGALPVFVGIKDSATDFAWRANFEGAVGLQFKSGLDLSATAGFNYGNRHIVDVRRNPTDSSTAIGTKPVLGWSVGVRARANF